MNTYVKLIAEREVRAKVSQRSFLISLAIMAALVVGMVILNNTLSGRTSTETVGVISSDGAKVVADAGPVAEAIDDNTELESETFDDEDALRSALEAGDVDAGLVPGGKGWILLGNDEVDDLVTQSITSALNPPQVTTPVDQELLDPKPKDDAQRQVLALILALLFYFVAVVFGMAIAQSVVEEKESRVVEILAAAVPTRAMLWGKVLGNSILALGQVVLLVAVGVIGLVATGQADFLSGVGGALAWYVVFFVVGFVTLSALWSAAGTLASRVSDLQSTTMPLQMVLLGGYLLAFALGDQAQRIASFVPIISPIAMPSRLAAGDVPLWQILVSLALNIVAAFVLVRLGAKIYDRNLMQTQGKVGFGQALGRR